MSLSGNSLLLLVAYRKRSVLKPAEFFIVNLAISDLSMTVTLFPLATSSFFAHRYPVEAALPRPMAPGAVCTPRCGTRRSQMGFPSQVALHAGGLHPLRLLRGPVRAVQPRQPDGAQRGLLPEGLLPSIR